MWCVYFHSIYNFIPIYSHYSKYRYEIIFIDLFKKIDFTEKNISGMMAACQSGLMRTMHVGKEKVADLIPVDVVINCMIVAAWKRGKAESNNNFTSEPIPIYQSTSGNLNPITWGQIEEWALLSIRKFPLDSNTMVWYVY